MEGAQGEELPPLLFCVIGALHSNARGHSLMVNIMWYALHAS